MYQSPFKKLSIIVFCIILALILREIARAENVVVHSPDITEKTIYYLPRVEQAERSVEVYKVTAYCPCPKCCGEWSDGFTYSGELAHEGVTIAADLSKLPLGTKVNIEGIGERTVQDIGGAIKENKIDLFFYNHADALKFGVQYLEVTILQ